MNNNDKLNDQDRWLAAEYALGVLPGAGMKEAEKRSEMDASFKENVEAWQAQLSPLLDEVAEVAPPAAVWKSVDSRLFQAAQGATAASGSETGSGFWKLITALTSTVAVACFAMLMFVTGGDFTGREIEETRLELASAKSKAEESATALATAKQELETAALRLADLERAADVSEAEIASARQ